MRRRPLLVVLPLLALTGGRARASVPLTVVASFSILADLVRQVGGERVAVRALVGPDASAHDHQPRPSDARALREAGLVVRNGLGFEPWLDRLLRAGGGRAVVVVASDGVAVRPAAAGHAHAHDDHVPDHADGHDHGHAQAAPAGAPDPHAWQDVALARRYAATIARALAAADSAGTDSYQARLAAFDARLAALDAWVRAEVATVPPARRVLLTSHDAFGYLGAAYGIRVLAPQGAALDAQPSAAAVAGLVRQVRAEGIRAVFLEGAVNPTLLSRLAAEAGVTVRGRLYADALSGPDGPAPTYEAMVRHNLGLIVPAMRGA